MHKAIAIIQFKLEGALYQKHPEWNMNDRALLFDLNPAEGTCKVDGVTYELTDTNFPTIDPEHPYELTVEEVELIEKLRHSFLISDHLQNHVQQLLQHGSMYGIYNSNLLFHASVPMNEDGSLKVLNIEGQNVSGREMLDRIEQMVRLAYDEEADHVDRGKGHRLFLVSMVRTQLAIVRQIQNVDL